MNRKTRRGGVLAALRDVAKGRPAGVEEFDPTRGRSAGTSLTEEFDPTQGRSASRRRR